VSTPLDLAELRRRAEAWIAGDPDETTRSELADVLARGDESELIERFAVPLAFGTAGMRGRLGAGPGRMNRTVVIRTTLGLAKYLLATVPDAAARGAVVGFDARRMSRELAEDAAAVLAGAGITVHRFGDVVPTPLVSFAVTHLKAAAGIMITASHNPAADNGYKLYLSDGGQVIPPADAEIEKRVAALGPLSRIPVAPAGSPLITRHGDEIAQAYLAAVAGEAGPAMAGLADPVTGEAATSGEAGAAAGEARAGTGRSGRGSAGRGDGLNVVYTAMHGVAGQLMLRAMRLAGFGAPYVVAAQAEPDPDFPTVAFPNPEEPGALDLALADARRLGADVIIASDPDGDRLAVAVPGAAEPGKAGWRVLTGDQVGALLGAGMLDWTAGQGAAEARLVASTVVSSTLLSKIAAAAGVRYAETLTGFKWIARAADGVPGARFVFGYEEALGYAVGDVVRDKDGFGAALAMLRLAAGAKAAGRSVLDVYDELERRHGVHLTSQVTLRTADQAQVMRRLRAAPPDAFGAELVSGLTDLAAGAGDGTVPRADVLIFRLAGGRVVLRPSGTEPKIKCYIEITEPVAGGSLAQARAAAAGRLAPLRAALEALLAAGAPS
jgi:phosphomannomutase